MRISDWSSDVCSSDLNARLALASTFQAQFVEQHIAKLLGAPDGERHSRLRIDFLLQRFDLACEFGRKTGKMFAVHLDRSEEHTSELQSLMRISYAVFCLKKNTTTNNTPHHHNYQ